MDPAATDRIRREIERLPAGVKAHIEEVRRGSADLARCHRLDVARAELAALAHDVCRMTPGDDLLLMARDFKLPVTPLDEAFPVFLHGPVGAEVLRLRYGITDPDVLDPVRFHTTARAGMTPTDKVLFLADKLDPGKISRFPFIADVGRLAREDLDRAMVCFIDNQAKAFIDKSDLLHPGMIAARNEALLALRGTG